MAFPMADSVFPVIGGPVSSSLSHLAVSLQRSSSLEAGFCQNTESGYTWVSVLVMGNFKIFFF